MITTPERPCQRAGNSEPAYHLSAIEAVRPPEIVLDVWTLCGRRRLGVPEAGTSRRGGGLRNDSGYAMAALLVAMFVMGIMLTVAMPHWKQVMQREREEELIFRGNQYARAIGLYQQKFAGAFPPNLQVLFDQKFLRKLYKDPMTRDGQWQLLYQQASATPGGGGPGTPGAPGRPQAQPSPSSPTTTQPSRTAATLLFGSSLGTGGGPGTAGISGAGGVIGVASKSKEQSIKIYNGRTHYNEWQFVYVLVTPVGGQRPGGPGQPGGPGRPGEPGRPGGIERPGGRPFESGTVPPGPPMTPFPPPRPPEN